MKIMFDSDEDRYRFIGKLVAGMACPSRMDLNDSKYCEGPPWEERKCEDCWFNALLPVSEVKCNE